MSSAPLEQRVQRKILSYLENSGAFCFKTITCNKRGIPDITAVYKGVPIFIEVKRDKYHKPTEMQQYQMAKITEAGGRAVVAFSIDPILDLLLEIDKSQCENIV